MFWASGWCPALNLDPTGGGYTARPGKAYEMNMQALWGPEALALVPVSLWQSPGLSAKAKGLYAMLLTLPGGFLPPVAIIEEMSGLGKDARQAAYRELRAAGLLETRIGTWSVRLPMGVRHGA